MAYADQNTQGTRTATFVTVAALHGAAIWALVVGLSYVKDGQIPTIFTARNIPAEAPKTPPPPPQAQTRQTAPKTHIETVVPPSGVDVNANSFAVDVSDLPSASGTVIDVPTGPIIEPSPTPSFTPRFARPIGNPGAWVTTDDYPTSDLRAGHQGATRFRVAVSAAGRVTDCQVVQSSGWPGLDAAACDKISRRAKFEPATDSSGQAVSGSFTSNIRWVIPE